MSALTVRPSTLEQAFANAVRQTSSPPKRADRKSYRPTILPQISTQLALLNLDAATKLLREQLHDAPDDDTRHTIACEGATLLFTFADLFSRADAADAAVGFLREALTSAPNVPFLYNALGRACFSLGTLTASREQFLESLRAYDTALAMSHEESTPGDVAFRSRVIVNKAITLWQLAELSTAEIAGDLLSQAEGLIRPLLDTLPTGAHHAARLDLARAHEALGNVVVKQGNVVEALPHLLIAEKAATTPFDRARILNNIGAAHSQDGAIDLALEAYSSALALLPKKDYPVEWSRTQRNRGDALRVKSGNYQERRPILREAIAILKEAREICTDTLSPYLRSLITISLAEAVGDLSVVATDSIYRDNALYLYDEAIRSLDIVTAGLILKRRDTFIVLFEEANRSAKNRIEQSELDDNVEPLHSNIENIPASLRIMDPRAAIIGLINGVASLPEARRHGLIARVSGMPDTEVNALSASLVGHAATLLLGDDVEVPYEREAGGAVAQILAERLPPIPTHDELAAQGKLFKAKKRNGTEIIPHLLDPDKPWRARIEAKVFATNDMCLPDPAGYQALRAAMKRDPKGLKDALGGYEIPTKTQVIDRLFASAVRTGTAKEIAPLGPAMYAREIRTRRR